jgi:hypothetical protein
MRRVTRPLYPSNQPSKSSSVTWVGQWRSSGQSAHRGDPIFTANFCHKVNEAQGQTKGQTDQTDQTDPQGTRIGRR